MKRILLVFTGGTIGSSVTGHTIDTDPQNAFRLIQLYRQNYDRSGEITFETCAPIEILSENLFPSVWIEIITTIHARLANDPAFDGIVITHGTDTLAYTACALSFCFVQHLQIPLVRVSSNYPLTDARANGLDNFNTALEFICQRSEPGVFVAYRNPNQTAKIHLGSRLLSCLPLSGDFISVQSKTYLEFNGHDLTVLNPCPPQLENKSPTLPTNVQFSTRILLIRPYPGLNYAQFNLQNIDVVLHDLYHFGTACVTTRWGDNYSLIHFLEKCRQVAIPVYLAPAAYTIDTYSSTQALLTQGVQIIWNMSLEATYVKLLLAYGNFTDASSRQSFLNQNIANEQIEITINNVNPYSCAFQGKT